MPQGSIAHAHATAEDLFRRHRAIFGSDLSTYQGHVHRVIGLVGMQTEVSVDAGELLGLAAFFHDSGIWFDSTWDYLPASARRARAEMGEGAHDDGGLVVGLIDEHHRLRRARHEDPLVEAFRRADLTDVSGGLLPSPGVSRRAYKDLAAEYPARGFRPMLLRAFGRGLRQDPVHPLPMMKW